MRNHNLSVALTKCFFCGKDNTIMINTRLTEMHAARVEACHGKVADMRPCSECEGYMKQGVILITFDPAKSDKDWNNGHIPNPYRTGGWFVVRDSVLPKIFGDGEATKFALKHRWCFIEHEAAEKVGMFQQLEEKEN